MKFYQQKITLILPILCTEEFPHGRLSCCKDVQPGRCVHGDVFVRVQMVEGLIVEL
jgi:hypothetical protein